MSPPRSSVVPPHSPLSRRPTLRRRAVSFAPTLRSSVGRPDHRRRAAIITSPPCSSAAPPAVALVHCAVPLTAALSPPPSFVALVRHAAAPSLSRSPPPRSSVVLSCSPPRSLRRTRPPSSCAAPPRSCCHAHRRRADLRFCHCAALPPSPPCSARQALPATHKQVETTEMVRKMVRYQLFPTEISSIRPNQL